MNEQRMNEQALYDRLKEKMSELMELYNDNKMHSFTVTDEVKTFGLLLLEEYQNDGLIASMRKSEQILLVAHVLKEVRTEHQKAHNYY